MLWGENGWMQSIPHIVDRCIDWNNYDASLGVYSIGVVQIYCEKIIDLIREEKEEKEVAEMGDKEEIKSHDLKVRDIKGIGVAALGQRFVVIKSREDIERVIRAADKNKLVPSTAMSERRRPYHTLLTIQRDQFELQQNTLTLAKTAKFMLVDLAPSERVAKTGAFPEALNQTKTIGMSLSAFANCILALTSTPPKPHIPFRDSKLTFLLKGNLLGQSPLSFIFCIEESVEMREESISTCRYMHRIGQLKRSRLEDRGGWRVEVGDEKRWVLLPDGRDYCVGVLKDYRFNGKK